MIGKLLAILAAILLVIVLVAVFFGRLPHKNTPASVPTPVAAISLTEEASLSLQTKTVSETSTGKKFTIDAKYPEIAVLNNASSVQVANKAIETLVQGKINGFKTDVNDNQNTFGLDAKNELVIDFSAGRVDVEFVSLEFRIMTYFLGSAHPTTVVETLTYDLARQKELSLSDLFKPGSDYLSTLSDFAVKDLTTKLGVSMQTPSSMDASMVDWIKKGAGPTADNFKHFLLKDDTLVILFDPYQVAAGVAGIQEVAIPYSQLESILAIDFSHPPGP